MAVITTSLVPDIGAEGIFTLVSPYDVLISTNVSYTCLAVRRLQEVLTAGGDPYASYYQPLETSTGQLKDQYNSDLANNVCIITLQPSSGKAVFVPSTFIANYPMQGGVAYSNLLLAVDIGTMPTSVDLTFLKQQIANLVKTTVGLTSVVITTVTVSPVTNVSAADHATAEASRQQNITNTTTPESQVLALQAQLQSLQQAYAALQTYVQANISKLSS